METTGVTYLSETQPEWGRVKLLREDSAIFGFNVGEYLPGDLRVLLNASDKVLAALETFAVRERVEVISSAAPAASEGFALLYERWGSALVDLSVEVGHTKLAAINPAYARLTVREVVKDDLAPIQRLVAAGFRHGRYHTDLHFPPELASKRYVQWITQGVATGGAHKVFVLGQPGEVWGVIYALLDKNIAQLRLGVVAKEKQSGIAGLSLYAGVLQALHQAGAERAVTRIQLANTPVMNLYAALGFQFREAHRVYHWHLPNAPHLLNKEERLNRIKV